MQLSDDPGQLKRLIRVTIADEAVQINLAPQTFGLALEMATGSGSWPAAQHTITIPATLCTRGVETYGRREQPNRSLGARFIRCLACIDFLAADKWLKAGSQSDSRGQNVQVHNRNAKWAAPMSGAPGVSATLTGILRMNSA